MPHIYAKNANHRINLYIIDGSIHIQNTHFCQEPLGARAGGFSLPAHLGGVAFGRFRVDLPCPGPPRKVGRDGRGGARTVQSYRTVEVRLEM